MKKLLITTGVLFFIVLTFQAQENRDSDNKIIEFKIKDNFSIHDSLAKPTIYVDGKKFNFDINLLDYNKIESVFVVKDKEAIEKYHSPQGVILIKTKLGNSIDSVDHAMNRNDNKKLDPLFVIDGEVVDDEMVKQLTPDDIESITVLKSKAAIKAYNAPNGAVVIKTKKKS